MRLLFIKQFFWLDTTATGQLLTGVARAMARENGPVSVLWGGRITERWTIHPAPAVTILRCGPVRF